MTDRVSVVVGDDGLARCAWSAADAEYRRYHDEEWGTPLTDDRSLFEKICLEGFQAGLSWITILKRRPAFREVFHDFDPEWVARMSQPDVDRLMADPRIIRNRAKIESTVGNARAVLALQGGLTELVWSFRPEARATAPKTMADLPTSTPDSLALSRALKQAGFRFVGATTVYALMESAGLVDDHLAGCWRSVDRAAGGA